MLRSFVVAVAVLVSCAGIGLIWQGLYRPGWYAFGFGVIVIVGTLFERWRYRPGKGAANGRWESTDERFVDPSSGDEVEVQFDPRSGERRYITRPSNQNKHLGR
jgi:hypothetical protein